MKGPRPDAGLSPVNNHDADKHRTYPVSDFHGDAIDYGAQRRYAFERLRLPRVIGEICGGLLVGPSVLGLLAPDAMSWLVPDQLLNGKLLSAVYWLGLMLLMFTAGFKVQQNFDAEDRRFAGLLLLGAIDIRHCRGGDVDPGDLEDLHGSGYS